LASAPLVMTFEIGCAALGMWLGEYRHGRLQVSSSHPLVVGAQLSRKSELASIRCCDGHSSTSPLLSSFSALAFVGTVQGLQLFQIHRGKQRQKTHKIARGAGGVKRNKGIDPERLLGTLRKAGIGPPRPEPSPSPTKFLYPNSREATLFLLDRRRQSMQKGLPGIRPGPNREREYRLPLIVKYFKPAGIESTTEPVTKKSDRDLRPVVIAAGDRFELDLYHPAVRLATEMRGLLIWSRSLDLSSQINDDERGIVHSFDIEVFGIVDEEELQNKVRSGVDIGVDGFSQIRQADIQATRYLEDSTLQNPRSMISLRTRNAKDDVQQLIERCGFKVIQVICTAVGMIQLGNLQEGELIAAGEDEEAWACEFAGLPLDMYPASAREDLVLSEREQLPP